MSFIDTSLEIEKGNFFKGSNLLVPSCDEVREKKDYSVIGTKNVSRNHLLVLRILEILKESNVKNSVINKIINDSFFSDQELDEMDKNFNIPLFRYLFDVNRCHREFMVDKKIGEGGFGCVYSAIHRVDTSCYAIKKIHFSFKDQEHLEKIYFTIIREVQCLAKTNHPNIVRYNSCWFEPHLENTDFEKRMKKRQHLQREQRETPGSETSRTQIDELQETAIGFDDDDLQFSMDEVEDDKPHQHIDDHSDSDSETRNHGGCSMSNSNTRNSMYIDDEESDDDESTGWIDDFSRSKRTQNININNSRFGNGNGEQKKKKKNNILFQNGSMLFEDYESDDDDDDEGPTVIGIPHSPLDYQFNKLMNRKKRDEYINNQNIGSKSPESHINRNRNTTTTSTSARTRTRNTKKQQDTIAQQRTPIDILFNSETGKYQMDLFIQMELCNDQTLEDYLWTKERTSTLKPDYQKCMQFFSQIVAGIAHIHSMGIVHRDLKPSNIFFSHENCKIGDFGLSKELRSNIFRSFSLDNLTDVNLECNQSKLGVVQRQNTPDQHSTQIGTLLYSPSEMEEGNGKYNNSVDIYALGIILFELLICFSAKVERAETLLKLKQTGIVEDRFKQQFPDEMKLVEQMIHHDPLQRPNAKDLHQLMQTKYNTYSTSLSTEKDEKIKKMEKEIEDLKNQLIQLKLGKEHIPVAATTVNLNNS